eukprot:TRINITY_DN3446_c0_g1_i1.p1 TRINITY_DN3446_c0_g1~~TRINITY_DN3446_c0_g1_i1.p1  ORF type:complete len:255 (+),score=38.90 TRINITY_DN3446_c0_g1_i1:60-824(+)
MKMLTLFAIFVAFLFVASVQAKSSVPITATFDILGHCNCFEDACMSRSASQGEYLEDFVTNSKNFFVVYENFGGATELSILNKDNYQKFKANKPYDDYKLTARETCQTFLIEADFEDTYYALSKCVDPNGCILKVQVWEDGCISMDKRDCKKSNECGWCKGMEKKEGHDFCVPGKAFKPHAGITCSSYFNHLGLMYIVGAVAIALCLLCCIVVCCCCCCCKKKRRPQYEPLKTTLFIDSQTPYQPPQSTVLAAV